MATGYQNTGSDISSPGRLVGPSTTMTYYHPPNREQLATLGKSASSSATQAPIWRTSNSHQPVRASCWPSAPSGRRQRLPMYSAVSGGCVATAFRGTGTIWPDWDEIEYGARALANRDLALDVARHKAVFFRENDINGDVIDYTAAVSGRPAVGSGRARFGRTGRRLRQDGGRRDASRRRRRV